MKSLAVNHVESYCMGCQKHFNLVDLKVIEISELGYGSMFDGASTKIQLCPECYKKSIEKNPHLWDLEVLREDYCEEYKYESEISDYISNLPIISQELVWNRFTTGYGADHEMEPQDWIDYQEGNLSEAKCKAYGLYSVEERKMYAERFPTCVFVANKLYKDGSSGAFCPFGASGRSAEVADEFNISTECRHCNCYKKRTDENIKEISVNDWVHYTTTVIYNEKYKGKDFV